MFLLDHSQKVALCAALNMKNKLLAIHGPPGTGKTRVLVEFLLQTIKNNKRPIVISKSPASLYNLIGNYWQMADTERRDKFICLRKFDHQLATRVIGNSAIRDLLAAKSNLPVNVDKMNPELMEINEAALRIRKAIIGNSSQHMETCKEEEKAEQLETMAHEWKNENMRELISMPGQVIFATASRSLVNMFIPNGLTFDVIILDGAHAFNEFESWWTALPMAPIIRLFGDINQPTIPIKSPLARKLGYDKSLLHRLEKEFGQSVNFPLRRQYRSNPAIQEWPNRVFYGKRAAETDKSVKNIRLNDLIKEDEQRQQAKIPINLITNPLVLVDLSRLEGQWHHEMLKESMAGKSFCNWGEALLVATHLLNLFEHIPQCSPSKIVYSTLYEAQRIAIKDIFATFYAEKLKQIDRIRLEKSNTLQDQQFDVVIQSFVVNNPDKLLSGEYHLRHLASEMCRARRQYILLANSESLKKGSTQSRRLLQTFHEKGQIIGPNHLLPLKPNQFLEMQKRLTRAKHERQLRKEVEKDQIVECSSAEERRMAIPSHI